MIPHPHRMKGAALLLGARAAGEVGPFGPYGGDREADGDDRNQAHTEQEQERTQR
ncbi:hypothetical protein OG393_22730 [Streptomyces sp. NBC_01216]|uniref:hypothetical protein n=1 Tax=Streptomyces sp. NBC_01216 TaxID=2903778 RepID=UPI002E127FDB|nr:hypothetical protein OG393_22730 [Streptomyces sp. NBC_01216]